MTKKATTSSRAEPELKKRKTRAQSALASRRPMERRRTRASAYLDSQASKGPSRLNSVSNAPEQPNLESPPRKRWFLAYVEIPPYPRIRPRVPRGGATVEKTTQPSSGKPKRRNSATLSEDTGPLAPKPLRRSNRGRVERPPSTSEPKEAQETASGAQSQFDWWYECSLSPLTEPGSRSSSPVAEKDVSTVQIGLEVEAGELDVLRSARSPSPQETLDATTRTGGDTRTANLMNNGTEFHLVDELDVAETSSLSSVPTQKGNLSDDQCPTEAHGGSPTPDQFQGDRANSPTLTSVNSPERVLEPSVQPRLEITPVPEVAFPASTIRVRTLSGLSRSPN